MFDDDTNRPLPDDATKFPPAAYGAGAPSTGYASYKLLRSGDWGLNVPGKASPGDLIVVRRRDQTERRERVGRMVWEGTDRDGAPVGIYTIDRGSQPVARTAPAQRRQRIARRNANRTAAVVAAAPVVARVTGVTSVAQAIELTRGTRAAASQRQAMPVIADEPDVDAARHAIEATLGLDEPLF